MTGPTLKAGDHLLSLPDVRDTKSFGSLSDFDKKVILFCQSWLGKQNEFEFHTSGSTGTPKKIVFTREQLITSAQLTASALDLKPGHTSLICLNTEFIAGAMMVVRSLVTGMNMITVAPTANPLENLSDPIDFAAFVPYQLTTMIEHARAKLNTLRTIIIGGAPLKNDDIKSLQSLSPDFYATYGMTETITHVALQKLNGPDRRDYFQLLPGITASIDNRGCLVVKASHLGTDVITTNDVVSLIDDNKFRWLGRYDQVINSGGVKVYPQKIEDAVAIIFKKLEITNRFFVSGIADDKLGEQVALIIEGTSLESETEERAKSEMRLGLEKYESPRLILYADTFLETDSQKIDRMKTLKTIKN